MSEHEINEMHNIPLGPFALNYYKTEEELKSGANNYKQGSKDIQSSAPSIQAGSLQHRRCGDGGDTFARHTSTKRLRG